MTIPIMPGPFSFLAQAGQALGQFGEEKNKLHEQRIKEARDALNQMLDLRSKNLIDPSKFDPTHNPRMSYIYDILGVAPVSTQPTSTETSESIKRRYLAPDNQGFNLPVSSAVTGAQDLAPVPVRPTGANVSPREQIFAGIDPNAVAKSQLEGGKIGAQSGAVAAGGAAGRVVTGVPSEPVAAAQESTALTTASAQQDVYQNSLAERMVDSALTRHGINPIALADLDKSGIGALVSEAWQTAQTDAKSRGQTLPPEQLTRPYIEAAIASRVREAQKEKSARIASQNAGRGGNQDASYMRLILGLRQGAIQALASLPKIDSMTLAQASFYESELAKVQAKYANDPEKLQKAVAALGNAKTAWDMVQMDKATRLRLTSDIDTYGAQVGEGVNNKIGIGGDVSTQPRMWRPDQVSAATAMILSGQSTLDYFKSGIALGKITQADYDDLARSVKDSQAKAKP